MSAERRRLRAGVEVDEVMRCQSRREYHGALHRCYLLSGHAGYHRSRGPVQPRDRVEELGEEPKVFTSQWDTGKPDADGFTWETFPQEDPRMEELEKRIAVLEGQVALLIATEDVPAPVQSTWSVSPTPAPEQDAAGGDEPSAEEVSLTDLWKVEQWLELFPEHNKEAREALRLIRAGQQDTRPVLTEEVVEEAATAWDTSDHWLEAARRGLLSTGAFREVSDGE